MFSARRKPKRIVRDEAERTSNTGEEPEPEDGPVVRRPQAPPKNKSKLRTSFAPDEADDVDTSDPPAVIKTRPKARPGHSTSTQSLPRFNLDPRSAGHQDDSLRPSYSKSALEELRNSTPSTPKDLSVYDPSSGTEDSQSLPSRTLDVASKFGTPSSSAAAAAAIPSASEIAEKKSRRARRAQEQAATDFVPLEEDDAAAYDSDGEFKPRRMQVGAYLQRDGEKNTRLVRDDEDLLEGFDEFTEDRIGGGDGVAGGDGGRLTMMGRKQIQEAERRRRETMRAQIATVEGRSSGNDDDDGDSASDSERERNRAYETAQTGRGLAGDRTARSRYHQETHRPRQPREVTPVVKLNVALDKLREQIQRIEIERVKIERRKEEIRAERIEVKASQEHIQKSLTEAGEELQRVQQTQAEEESRNQRINGSTNGDSTVMVERGLDRMGFTPEPT